MIRQLSQFIARVVLNKNAGNYEEAQSNVEAAFGTILGLDSGLLDTLPADDIAELLGIAKDKPAGSMKCLVAARLLKERADILELSGKDGTLSAAYFLKALRLYVEGLLSIGYTELDLTGYHADVRLITEKLGNSLPVEVMQKMSLLHKRK